MSTRVLTALIAIPLLIFVVQTGGLLLFAALLILCSIVSRVLQCSQYRREDKCQPV